MKFICLLACILSLTAFGMRADVATEARDLLEQGDYAAALEMARESLSQKKNASKAGTLSQIAGEAAYWLGDEAEAESFFERARKAGVADAFLFSGRMAFADYDFLQAGQYYRRYLELCEKTGREPDPEAESAQECSVTAQDMLDRVEQIEVFDRLDVDRDDFFRHYILAPSSGKLIAADEIAADYPESVGREAVSPVFENEENNFRLWASLSEENEHLSIVESFRLVGGNWSEPLQADSVLNQGADAAYPFMMADGSTLYFASNGEGSIGGYDIFRSNRDPETAEYQTPANMGMPYNSPHDDYLLAIDEESGIGWWATDRNQLGDKVSIYLFIPNEVRRNYNAEETDSVPSLARLDDIELTWPEPDADFQEKRDILSALQTASASLREKDEFFFPVGRGKIYRRFDDFSSPRARALMQDYLQAEADYRALRGQIASLRRTFRPGMDNSAILRLEKADEESRARLKALRNQVISAESR